MPRQEPVGELGGAQNQLHGLAGGEGPGGIKALPVPGGKDPVRQFHAAAVGEDVAEADHRVGVLPVAEKEQLHLAVPGDGEGLLQGGRGVAEVVLPPLLLGVVLRHLQLVLAHVDDVMGRVHGVIEAEDIPALCRGRLQENAVPGAGAGILAVGPKGKPPLGRGPDTGGVPPLLPGGVVFHRRALLHPVFLSPQKPLQPPEVEQVQVEPQGILPKGEGVEVVLAVAAVLPGPQYHLAVGPVPGEVQGLGGAHAVVIKPAGLDKHRHRPSPPALELLRPVPPPPKFIVVPVVQVIVQKGHRPPQGLFRQLPKGPVLQHLVPVGAFHQAGVKPLAGDREGPGEHPGDVAATPAGEVHKAASGSDHADHRLQVGASPGGHGPLDIPQVGAPGGADAPVAPVLGGHPLQGGGAVLHLVGMGDPGPGALPLAPHVLDNQGVPPADVPQPAFRPLLPVVGGADEEGGHRPPPGRRQVDVGGQLRRSVTGGDAEGLHRLHRGKGLPLVIRPKGQGSPSLQAGAHQHHRHLPAGGDKGRRPAPLQQDVGGEFFAALPPIAVPPPPVLPNGGRDRLPLPGEGRFILLQAGEDLHRVQLRQGFQPGRLGGGDGVLRPPLQGVQVPQGTGDRAAFFRRRDQPGDGDGGKVQDEFVLHGVRFLSMLYSKVFPSPHLS